MINNPKAIALPPVEYMEFVCGAIPEVQDKFLSVGEQLAEFLLKLGMLAESTDFLDIGCGCGRLTRFLVKKNISSYTGFDRHPGMIEWCQKEISPLAPNFQFDLFELKSAYDDWDKIDGKINAATFNFPYPDNSFNAILLASVFTHMPLNETAQYLLEIGRVLSPNGQVLLSVFLAEEEAYSDQIDFYYTKKEFLTAVSEANLSAEFKALTARHNWYLLKPL